MARIESTLVVKRPVAEVFAFLTDGANNPKWELEMIDFKPLTTGPIGVGTRFQYVRQFNGMRVTTVSEIIEFEPNQKWGVKSAMGLCQPLALLPSHP